MEQTVERTVTLGSKSGLHARPAAVFVRHAKSYQSEITLSKEERAPTASPFFRCWRWGLSRAI
jgi:phosphotransferase system HPr (HPr) family protein